jgi:hypothetical protein
MKKIIFYLLAAILTIPATAQQTKNLFDELTGKYADQEGFSASMLTSDMFDLYIKKRNLDESSPVFEALKKLDYITVISQSKFFTEALHVGTAKASPENKNMIHETILDHYRKNGYTLFKTEKRLGEDVKVFLMKNQDKIVSLALITNSESSTNLVELQGDIDLKTVAELNKAMNLKGLENLNKLDNNNSNFYGISGNLAYPQRIEELAARQREMFERQSFFTNEQRAAIEDQAHASADKQMQMAEKYREMAEKYGREPIFLNYPGDTNTVYYIDGKKVKAKEIKDLDKGKIESVEIKKPEKGNNKTTVRIKTK